MGEPGNRTGETHAKGVGDALHLPREGEFRRCLVCQGTIPPTRRKMCSARCARLRKVAAQALARKRALG